MNATLNVLLSIPLGILIYLFVEKCIGNTTNVVFSNNLQKKFVLGFIIGIALMCIAIEVVGNECMYENPVVWYALCGSSLVVILNNTLLNWSDVDDSTKMMILCVTIAGIIAFSYHKNNKVAIKDD